MRGVSRQAASASRTCVFVTEAGQCTSGKMDGLITSEYRNLEDCPPLTARSDNLIRAALQICAARGLVIRSWRFHTDRTFQVKELVSFLHALCKVVESRTPSHHVGMDLAVIRYRKGFQNAVTAHDLEIVRVLLNERTERYTYPQAVKTNICRVFPHLSPRTLEQIA